MSDLFTRSLSAANPAKETHLGRLHLLSHSFEQYLKLVTIAEGWNADGRIDQSVNLAHLTLTCERDLEILEGSASSFQPPNPGYNSQF